VTGRLRVLVCYGGRSAEHDVSCVSAAAVATGLDPGRYEVVPVAITRDGRWLAPGAEVVEAARAGGPGAALAVTGEPLGPFGPSGGEGDGGATGAGGFAAAGARVLRLPAADVVFPVLHGPYGEDGTVQGLCALLDLPCVGAGVLGSAVAMDKAVTKRLLAQAGLPVPRWLELRDGDDRDRFCAEVAERLGFPCFVKPANLGSSVGVTKVAGPAGLGEALEVALAHDAWVLAEEAVAGREIEVSVLAAGDAGDAGGEPLVSVPGEIVPADEFYTYADKYLDGAAELRIPAPLGAEDVGAVQALARAAVRACRVEGMARVDCFHEPGGRGFLINELNTIPGFTPISMYPKLWEASGIAYPALLDRLVADALARHEARRRRAPAPSPP
jgi:D-alanine-D-alanine ligase